MPSNPNVNVLRGQRAFFPQNGAGQLIVGVPQTLLRAEDPKRLVRTWQVTLAPVFQQGVGPVFEGMPAFLPTPVITTGSVFVRMTWGGGGVSFRTTFAYPVAGSSFAVAGDNVMVEIIALDGTTVFTSDTLPIFSGWVKEAAQPTAPQPLLSPQGADLAGPSTFGIFPFCRALWVYPSNQAAVITIVFDVMIGGAAATQTLRFVGYQRIPVASNAVRGTVSISAGTFSVHAEQVFT